MLLRAGNVNETGSAGDAMDAIILSIGDELITGQSVDTNSAWLASRLSEMGIRVVLHETVGDDEPAIESAFQSAMLSAGVIIATGGLGPTDDDLTRQALARTLGQPLVAHPQAMRELEAYFARMDRELHPANRRQALIPETCECISNTAGTAPGILHRAPDRIVAVLPGVPREMKAMFDRSIAPLLAEFGGGSAIKTTCLHTYGKTEARIGEMLGELMQRGRNPAVGTTASHGVISVRIIAHGRNADDAAKLLSETGASIRQRLGELVFGENDDSMQSVLVRELMAKRLTIATAESCTGGMLSSLITDVPGSSSAFLQGFATYANEAKTRTLGVPAELIERCGAVSEEVAREMARRCRETAGSDFAIGITGLAGPTGGTPEKPIGLVYIGFATAAGTEVYERRFGDHLTRDEIRRRTCMFALNLARLELQRKRYNSDTY